jgi:hypothetical protein
MIEIKQSEKVQKLMDYVQDELKLIELFSRKNIQLYMRDISTNSVMSIYEHPGRIKYVLDYKDNENIYCFNLGFHKVFMAAKSEDELYNVVEGCFNLMVL